MTGAEQNLATTALGYVGQFQAPNTSRMLRVKFGGVALDVVAKEVMLEGGGGGVAGVSSVDGQTGAVSLSSTYVAQPAAGDPAGMTPLSDGAGGYSWQPGGGGTPGDDGADGREVELQTSATHVQWRYAGDVAWIDLIALTTITGADGNDGDDGLSVELQTTATHIQWRQAGGTWADLVALSTITGPAGDDGADADTSGQFATHTLTAAATVTLSADYPAQALTMTSDTTLAAPTISDGTAILLWLSGAFTPTWWSGIKWPGGTAPTYTSPSLYVFATFDGGATWLGVQSGKAFA
jgi:hypothetical protein